MSISVKRMKKLLKDDYQIIDIRSAEGQNMSFGVFFLI